MKKLLLSVAMMLGLAVSMAPLTAYVLNGPRWPDGNVVMQLQLGNSNGALIDGSASWGPAIEPAMSAWNGAMARLRFRVVRDSTAQAAERNTRNDVFWSNTVYGDAFATDTLASTLWRSEGNRMVETDVIFNRAHAWNSYRGPRRQARSGGTLQDIRRVALHEFGHVLGLGHPDKAGQSVVAIMNSQTGDRETLGTDDQRGVQALYGRPSGSSAAGATFDAQADHHAVTSPGASRDDVIAFRHAMEQTYRSRSGHAVRPTFADIADVADGVLQYFAYRVSGCGEAAATERAVARVYGWGIQPACAANDTHETTTLTGVDEAQRFRDRLESEYRDVLRRPATTSAVPFEDEVVRLREYLRARQNGNTHEEAVSQALRSAGA